MPENEIDIKIGDCLSDEDSDMIIRGYNENVDEFKVDLYNFDGKLIAHAISMDGQKVRVCFKEREITKKAKRYLLKSVKSRICLDSQKK